ncbi:MAG: hypothetical protein HYV09_36250 [Deltaproteobacteria bacterium]|nr:hypothetical protein [Deltaproteobacteria bacterium]
MRDRLLLVLLTLAAGTACAADPPESPAEPPPPASRRPPPRPTTTTTGERRWFVLSRVWLGRSDRQTGAISSVAWRQYGYDLDRRTTTAEDSKLSRNSCKRHPESHTKMLSDGAEGIDNNFGAHIMAVVFSLKSDMEETANREITTGRYTLLLRIDGAVGGDNAQAPGALYAAGPFAGTPAFRPDERWPVWDSSVLDGDVQRPVRQFPRGYVSKGVWVSGDVGEALGPIWVPMFAGPIDLQASAVITLDTRDGRGVIAGALPNEEVVRAADTWAAEAGFCRDEALATVEEGFSTFADTVIGAPDLQDPARSCDGISFGIGFDVLPTAAPSAIVAAPPAPPPLPACADAGA